MISITLNCASVDQLHQVLREMLKGEAQTRPGITHDPHIASRVDMDQYKKGQEKLAEGPQSTTVQRTQELVEANDPKAGFAVDVQPEKKTRTRKPKTEKPVEQNEATAIEPFETSQNETASQASPAEPVNTIPTKDQVHQALQQVNVALGLPAAREILKKFNVQRQSEIQPSQYRAFIEACNNVVAMS